MSNNLVIVESPAKAKTIEKYLGKKFIVSSCYGHIRDLPKDNKSIDKENGFTPSYVPSPDKKKIINELKKLKKKSDKVYLATDNDREGEAIAWHLKEILNLEEKDYDRIVFREITKKAILNSLENPTKINMDLVNAQQARRILDRIVGFEISPILWKKIKPKLSAGRVQSVAVKFVVERENEINAFIPNKSLKTSAVFITNEKNKFNADLKEKFKSIKEAENFLKDCSKSDFTINKINKKPSKRSPSAPFTTSTLQQEASRRIGFSPSMTMSTAQKLYESGHITYMRTDSVNLSEEAITKLKSLINSKFGQNYSKIKIYKTNNNNAQEAHEAIRPTNFNIKEIGKNENEKRLYNLIWRRTLASQMSDSIFERTVANITISNSNLNFTAEGEVQIFDGFLKLYNKSSSENEKKLPKLKENSSINFKHIISKEIFSKHLPRYTEASLIKKLEDSGIGRPSTYAETIRKIKDRKYVTKEERDGKEILSTELKLISSKISKETKTEKTGFEKNKMFPTNIGMFVTEFLDMNFNSSFMDYSFTAKTEKELDQIAFKGKKWNEMLKNFYSIFSSLSNNIPKERHSLEKNLGEIEGKNVIARIAKFGPVIQIGDRDDVQDGYPKYYNIPDEKLIPHISIEEAINIINSTKERKQLPSFPYQDGEIEIKDGRYGYYLRFGERNYKINKNEYPEPKSLTKDECIKIINTPIEKSKGIIKEFDGGIQIRLGKYGKPPYILAVRGTEIGKLFQQKRKKPFVGIPKEVFEKYKNSIENISKEEVQEIIDKFLKK